MRSAAGACVLGLLLLLGTGRPSAALEPGSPEDVVMRYLGALKEGKFDVAYDLVSAAMRQGKDHEAWVKEQKTLTAFADVKIFDFQVQPGKVEGEKAQVPNILSSQDRFVNTLGLTEFEIYTLLREDGKWKVDQQILVEPPDVPKWFPKAHGTKSPETPAASKPIDH
jgi:hypothetical protein